MERSLRTPLEPNDNDPVEAAPGTVGPPSYVPGDPDGITLEGSSGSLRLPPPRPAPWSGWPAEWDVPYWQGHLSTLADTAWACLDLNASILSTMAPYLVGAAQSLNTGWMVNPSPEHYVSWTEFAKTLFWDYMMGEAFVLSTARYDGGSGFPARFHCVPPWSVNVEMGQAGKRIYRIGSADVTADMLHIRYKSTVDDARGHGPLEAGNCRLVAARVLTQYGTNLAASGAVPNSVLTHPEELNAKQAEDLQVAWLNARLSSLGLPAVLSGGVTFEALQFSPVDMALLELLQFNEARICILLGVPPNAMALPGSGDPLTYSNTSSLFDYHWRSSLRPKAKAVMDALSGWLIPRGTFLELDRDEYVQPPFNERASGYQTMNNIRDDLGQPAMTVREIREAERLSEPSTENGVLR